jgi:hypothetical protein
MTLFQEFFGVGNIMDRMLGDFQTGDNLSIGINRDRGFQKSFSRYTGSPGIIVAGVRAGEPGRIDRGTGYLLSPIVKHFHEPGE